MQMCRHERSNPPTPATSNSGTMRRTSDASRVVSGGPYVEHESYLTETNWGARPGWPEIAATVPLKGVEAQSRRQDRPRDDRRCIHPRPLGCQGAGRCCRASAREPDDQCRSRITRPFRTGQRPTRVRSSPKAKTPPLTAALRVTPPPSTITEQASQPGRPVLRPLRQQDAPSPAFAVRPPLVRG